MDNLQSRFDEIRIIHKDYSDTYTLGGRLLLVLVGVLIGRFLFSDSTPLFNDSNGYFTNLWTETISVAFTLIFWNYLAEKRDERKRLSDLRQQLIIDAGSLSNEIALSAISNIKKKGWLQGEGGILKEQDLSGAKLKHADLTRANLKNANLKGANLSEATLQVANLEAVNFSGANLSGAWLLENNLQGNNLNHSIWINSILHSCNFSKTDLILADLRGADSRYSNFQGAQLINANLEGARFINTNMQQCRLAGANLRNADLSGTNLNGAKLSSNMFGNEYQADMTNVKCDETTVLPDGSNWTLNTDWRKFGAIVENN